MDSVVNVSGVVNASSAHSDGGSVVLGADTINTTATSSISANAGTNGTGGSISMVANSQGTYAGSFSATGGSAGGSGGKIETSGKAVAVDPNAKINASAAHGTAGTWLIDPLDVTIVTGANNGTITGATVTTGTIQNSLSLGTSVDITTSQSGSGLGDLDLSGTINATAINNASLTLEGRHLFETNNSTINIAGGALVLDVNTVNNTANPSGSWINDALGMIGTVSGGSTINLGAGTYTVAPGGGNYINVTKSNVTIDGAGEGNTIIDARNASTYGLRVSGPNSNVTLENFTLWGSSTYGLKAENTTNLTLTNIRSRGAGKSEFDLNGILGGTLTNLTADGAPVSDATDSTTTAGNGIGITDSQNVTLTGTLTKNILWGGLALYQTNSPSGYPYQEKNITVDATNVFNETNAIYAEDQSVSNDFGTLNLAGYTFIAQNLAGPNDFYTFFQKTEQGAINMATAAGPNATVQGYAGNGEVGTNTFYVGTSSGGTAMSIGAAAGAAADGATIDVLAGTYIGQVVVDAKDVTITGAGEGATTIEAPAALGHSFVAGGNTYKAIVSVEDGADLTISGVTIDGMGVGDANNRLLGIGIHDASATISDVDVKRVRNGGTTGTLNGVQAGVGIEAYNDDGVARSVSVKDSVIEDFQKNATAFVGGNLTVDVEGNTITGAGNTGLIAQNGIELFGVTGDGDGTVTGTVKNNTISGISFNDPNNTSATGILLWDASGTTVSGNSITGASAGATEASNGIYAFGSANLTISNNVLKGLGDALYLDTGSNNATVSGGSIQNSDTGVFVDPSVTGRCHHRRQLCEQPDAF